ncbi:tyrosine-type recombinase/integrase [Corticibacterium sp. UT-5YL-CI-8]|nr:tyrosine-type recombinase/integrase [Tianweitania sp. UT-5YL-CI-8]
MEIRLKYVVEDVDRHDNVRLYYRRKGFPKVRLPGPIGSPTFLAAYRAAEEHAKQGSNLTSKVSAVKPGSIRWLTIQYYQSAMFKELNTRTQIVRRGILERFCQNKDDGDKPYRLLMPRNLRTRRDEMMDLPEAANGMLKAVRQLYKFAVRYDHHHDNPAAKVEYLRSNNPDGFHAWTLEEIEQFEARHPVGTKARLAMALLLYLGQRRSDLVLFGKQHVRDGWLTLTQFKGRDKKPVTLQLPVIPVLQKVIDASPCGDLTFLVTEFKRPFTSNGFGNWFRKRCDEADLPQCSAHGLRKAASYRMAELGCTDFEIMAITGHTTLKEVTRYTKAASQKKRADSAMRKVSGEQKQS